MWPHYATNLSLLDITHCDMSVGIGRMEGEPT